MNGYISHTELQSAVNERLAQGKRHRITLGLGRRSWIRDVVSTLVTFLF